MEMMKFQILGELSVMNALTLIAMAYSIEKMAGSWKALKTGTEHGNQTIKSVPIVDSHYLAVHIRPHGRMGTILTAMSNVLTVAM